MNTNLSNQIVQEGNQSHKRVTKDQNAASSFEQNQDSDSSYSRICEPIVEIITGSMVKSEANTKSEVTPSSKVLSQDSFIETHASRKKNDILDCNSRSTEKEKEKYIFVLINNEPSRTTESSALRIIDIKSAVSTSQSADSVSVENKSFSIENVSFSVDQARNVISEVIKNLPDKRTVELNNSYLNHEFFLALNCSIPINIKQDSINNSFDDSPKEGISTVSSPDSHYPNSPDSGQDSPIKCRQTVLETRRSQRRVKEVTSKVGSKNHKVELKKKTTSISQTKKATVTRSVKNDKDDNSCNPEDNYEDSDDGIEEEEQEESDEYKPPEDRPVVCARCKVVFKNGKSLKQHLRKVCNKSDAGKPKMICDVCGKVYTNKNNFRGHMESHANLRQFKCDECPRAFNNRWFLARHIAQVHGGEKRPSYFCSHCGLKSESKEHIEKHEQIHLLPEGSEPPRPYQCSCGKAFISKHALSCHRYICAGNGRGKKKSRPSSKPRARRPPVLEPSFCEVCGRECKSRTALAAHRWYYHSEARRAAVESAVAQSCDQCGKTFANKTSLSSHKHRYHRPRDPALLACQICHKSFSDDGGLWAHNKYVHGRAQAFPCVLCGSRFKRKGDHTRHMKDRHGGERSAVYNQTAGEFERDPAPDEAQRVAASSFEMTGYTQL